MMMKRKESGKKTSELREKQFTELRSDNTA